MPLFEAELQSQGPASVTHRHIHTKVNVRLLDEVFYGYNTKQSSQLLEGGFCIIHLRVAIHYEANLLSESIHNTRCMRGENRANPQSSGTVMWKRTTVYVKAS